jgi:hypothetical protein
MRERITVSEQVTIGLDLGDKWSEACGVDARGCTVLRHRVRTTREGLDELHTYAGACVVVEAGTHSPWASRHLTAKGFAVLVANPRRVRLIAQSDASMPRCWRGSDARTRACWRRSSIAAKRCSAIGSGCRCATGWCGRGRSRSTRCGASRSRSVYGCRGAPRRRFRSDCALREGR